MKIVQLIDVWNLATFDMDLVRHLHANRGLIKHYLETDRANYLEREASDRPRPLSSNRYAAAYYNFIDELTSIISKRTIRAWHHSRMTDQEVEAARQEGLYPSTLESIRRRLSARVADSDLTSAVAETIFNASPFHNDPFAARTGKFWMTSHPRRVDDSGVIWPLSYWGGESAYFNHHGGDILDLLSKIGTPRVLEVAVPIHTTPDAYSAAQAVVATYGRSFDCHTDKGGFDLYTSEQLKPDALLRVHSAGEQSFAALARGYPVTFPIERAEG